MTRNESEADYSQLKVDREKRTTGAYTVREMRRALVVGWGALGAAVADTWQEYNDRYFDGQLLPLPIFLTPTTPYGHSLGWTCCLPKVTHIALASPHQGERLVANRDTLLHEMIHQCLSEQGLDPGHKGQPWRDEIMRLTPLLVPGRTIWAGKYTVRKERDAEGRRRSVKVNLPCPSTGRPSLPQGAIARWPHSLGIDLGPLANGKLSTPNYG